MPSFRYVSASSQSVESSGRLADSRSMRTDAGLVDVGHHSTVGRYRQTLMRRAGSLSLLCARAARPYEGITLLIVQ